MTDRTHTCSECGHVWKSIDDRTARDVRKAASINKTGPFCHLCQHIEMARRYANMRGLSLYVRTVPITTDVALYP